MILIFGGSSDLGKGYTSYFNSLNKACILVSRREFSASPSSNRYIKCDLSKDISSFLAENKETLSLTSSIIFAHRYRPFAGTEYSHTADYHASIVSPLEISRHAISHFSNLKSILFIGSPAAQFVCKEQQPQYHVIKSSIESLTRCLSIEGAPKNISVNCIRLGFMTSSKRDPHRSSGFYAMHEVLVPTGLSSTAIEYAKATASFLETENCLITGQVISADSGVSLLSQASVAQNYIELHR